MKTMGKKLYDGMFKFCIGRYPQELDERQMELVNAYYAKVGIVCSALLTGLFLVSQFVILAVLLAGLIPGGCLGCRLYCCRMACLLPNARSRSPSNCKTPMTLPSRKCGIAQRGGKGWFG